MTETPEGYKHVKRPPDRWDDCGRQHCAICNKHRRWIVKNTEAARSALDPETLNTARTDLVTS